METLVFVDKNRHFEIVETQLSSRTTFSYYITKGSDYLDAFLTQARFPSHALIVRPNVWDEKDIIFKGVQSFEDLKNYISLCCSKSADQSALLQTDMRAHLNPTRQYELVKAGIRLFRRLSRKCPFCDSPGWGIIGQKKGKLCSACHFPTRLPTHWIWGCVVCSLTSEKERHDFTYCHNCNP